MGDGPGTLWLSWFVAAAALVIALSIRRLRGVHVAAILLVGWLFIAGIERADERLGHTGVWTAMVVAPATVAIVGLYRLGRLTTGAAVVAAGTVTASAIRLPLAWIVALGFLLACATAADEIHRRNRTVFKPSQTRDVVDLAPVLLPMLAAVIVESDGVAGVVIVFAPMAFVLNDVMSSELGPMFAGPARLPPSFRPVPHGTPGAVSVAGLLAGTAGTLVAASAVWVFADLRTAMIVAAGGLTAAVVDSSTVRLGHTDRFTRSSELVNVLAVFVAIVFGFVFTV